MAGLMSQLIQVMEEHATLCEALAELGTRKKGYIIQNDVPALRKLTVEENTLVGKVQRAEKSRVLLVLDIAGVLNEKPEALTLSRLAEVISGQDEHEPFTRAAARMRAALEALKALNDQNKALLDNALEYVDFTINVIRSTYGDPSGYMPEDSQTPGRSFLDIKN